jgi:hypothetical protein
METLNKSPEGWSPQEIDKLALTRQKPLHLGHRISPPGLIDDERCFGGRPD